jgi:hypothetical protein
MFQRVFIGILFDLIHDFVEIYMDNFTIYGNSFEEVMENIEKN